MKKIALNIILLIIISAFIFTGCNKDDDGTTTQNYVYTPSGENTTDSDDASDDNKSINVDDSWKNNYKINYTYFNKEQSEDKITVCEKRSKNFFSAEDTDSGDLLYYKGGTLSVDSYVIVKGEDEQIHSVIKNKTLDDLSSTFMKLSAIDENLPSLANVMYMYEDTVAGRACSKYIQRAYTDGQLTETVYVWSDAEYGFALKGEIYDENDSLTASWEVIDFETGNIQDSDVEIDLTQYKITEE